MIAVTRRAGRQAEGTNVSTEERTPLQEPPMWRDGLYLPHHLEDVVNEAAELADEAPGGDFAFRASLWEIHDAHEGSDVEHVSQRDRLFALETEMLCEGACRVRAA